MSKYTNDVHEWRIYAGQCADAYELLDEAVTNKYIQPNDAVSGGIIELTLVVYLRRRNDQLAPFTSDRLKQIIQAWRADRTAPDARR